MKLINKVLKYTNTQIHKYTNTGIRTKILKAVHMKVIKMVDCFYRLLPFGSGTMSQCFTTPTLIYFSVGHNINVFKTNFDILSFWFISRHNRGSMDCILFGKGTRPNQLLWKVVP